MVVVPALAVLFLNQAQTPVLLTRVLPAKATETYKVDYEAEAVQGDAKLRTTTRWTQEFVFEEPDSVSRRVPLTVNVKNRTFETNVDNAEAPAPSQTIRGWSLSADNTLQKTAAGNEPEKRERLPLFDLPAVYVAFPKTPVKPGDSWEMPALITTQYGYKTPPLKVTFLGEKELDGKKYWNLRVDEAMKYEHGYAEDPTTKSKGTAKLFLDCLVDKETGRQEITDILYQGHNVYDGQYESDFKYKVRIAFVKDAKLPGA